MGSGISRAFGLATCALVSAFAVTGCSCGGVPPEGLQGSAESLITSPSGGALVSGRPLRVSGTASATDATLARVEVSFDDGASWQEASGLESWSADLTAADGTYTARSRATTERGAVEEPLPGVTFTLDNTPPQVTVPAAPAGGLIASGVKPVAGTASDANGVAKVEISLDSGDTWAAASGAESWSFAPSTPADGLYLLKARATDRAGNVSPVTAGLVLVVDNTPPASSMVSPADGAAITGATAAVSGTAADALSGLARVEVSADGGATWAVATGTAAWSYTWTLPADGTYTLLARAVDLAGNVEPLGAGRSVKVDTLGPGTILADPAPFQDIGQATYTIRGTATDGPGSGVARVEVSTDDGATWTAATGTSIWSYVWTTPADGPVTLRARAVDALGLVGTVSPPITVRVDKTAPATVIVSPAGGANLTGSGATIAGLVTDTGSGAVGVDVSLDNGATWQPATLSGNNWSFAWTFGGDGSYALRSRGRDAAGNVEAPQAGNAVKVDNRAPSSAVTAPANGSSTNAATYVVTGTCSDGAGSGVAGVEVSTDDGLTWAAATLGAGGTWSYPWTTPADGVVVVRSRATDGVGLVEAPAAGSSVTVDRTNPGSAIASPADGTRVATLTQTITGTASDALAGVQKVEISTDGGASWQAASGTSSWSFAWTLPAAAGAYVVRARATDLASNVETPGPGFTYHALPVVSLVAPASAAAGGAVDLVGFRFGASQGASTVTFNGVAATNVLAWSDARVRVAVPASVALGAGNVAITVAGETSNPASMTVLAQPPGGAGSAVSNGGKWTSAQLGMDGLPRVAHVASANGGGLTADRALLFSQYASGAWSTATVQTVSAGAIQYASLAVDANDANHLAWYESGGTGTGLHYAFCASACTTAANWTKATLQNVANRGQYASLAVDPAGHPRIAFVDASATNTCPATAPATTACLKYAACNGGCTAAGGWTYDTIPPTGTGTGNTSYGQWSALRIDASGNPHVAFQTPAQGDANYASKGSGVWVSVAADAALGAGNYNAIALSRSGLPRIAQYDSNAGAVVVSMYDGVGWTNCVVQAVSSMAAAGVSIQVGNDDVTRVLYNNNGSLRLATQNGSGLCTVSTTWAFSDVSASGTYGSLTLDALNRARATQLASGNALQYWSQ